MRGYSGTATKWVDFVKAGSTQRKREEPCPKKTLRKVSGRVKGEDEEKGLGLAYGFREKGRLTLIGCGMTKQKQRQNCLGDDNGRAKARQKQEQRWGARKTIVASCWGWRRVSRLGFFYGFTGEGRVEGGAAGPRLSLKFWRM